MISTSKRTCLGLALAVTLLAFFPIRATAQQITYYDFNAPQADHSEWSYSCPASPGTNLLFCFNGTTGDPSFFLDAYPSAIDPNPPAPGQPENSYYATQMTPDVSGQVSSMWFSVPQNIVNGFTAWFAFRLTPDSQINPPSDSYTPSTTADGIAFVIQNSPATGAQDSGSGCGQSGGGVDALGGGGGCLGYSGINNSVALEFDTYQNGWDPNNNHIALQGCGAGLPNSSDHNSPNCNLGLNLNPLTSASDSEHQLAVTLADGNVHQVVVEYAGPNDLTNPNRLQVFLDPVFTSGTHTPVTGSIPVLSSTTNVPALINLLNGTSAWVGFTSATGQAFERNELMAWTFTSHDPVTQQQPLQPPGSPTYTQFPFGTHTYAVQYPSSTSGVPNACSSTDTSDISMTVTANTVSPGLFSTLIAGTPFAGSTCQVYDDTGGNCVIYSASCSCTDTGKSVACPAATVSNCVDGNASLCLNVKTTYNNASTPLAPGFIQGDPFFSSISNLTVAGGEATVTCTGECSVVQNPDNSFTPATVTVVGAQPAALNGTYTVTGVSAPNSITASTTVPDNSSSPGNGGYLTSSNVKNIFTGWTPANIDGTSSGKTTNFSDFVFTDNTVTPATGTVLSAATTSPAPGQTDSLTATVTASIAQYGVPTGNVTFSTGLPVTNANTLCSAPVALVPSTGLAATATCTTWNAPATPGMSTIYATYNGDANHATSSNSLPLTVSQATPLITWPMASAITYGQTLASSTLSGGSASWNSATVPGMFAFTYPATAPGAGNPSESVTFTPNDTATYNPVTTTIPVQVNKAPVTIATAPTAGAILYGQTLAASNLTGGSATSTITGAVVPGMFTFTNKTTAPTTTGPQGITFIPADPADYLGTTGSVPVNVTAAPLATIAPSSIDFGTLYLGQIKLATVTITNSGNAPMTISDPLLAIVRGGNSNEFVTLNLCPKSLTAGKSCTMVVTFIAGPYYTPQTATLTIKDNVLGSPQTVPLTATVINPVAKFSTTSLAFGKVKYGTSSSPQSITVTNIGATNLTISKVSLSGANPGDFLVTNGCSSPLAPKGTCSISVTFKPTAKTSRSATLTVTSNAFISSQAISLSGTGN